MHTFFSLIYSN